MIDFSTINMQATQQNTPLGKLNSLLSSVKNPLSSAESNILNSAYNNIDIHRVVVDLSIAETNLKILTSVRDTLLKAWDEISKVQM